MRKFRAALRPFRSSPDGRRHWSFGIRVGYWPCLKAPYIHFSLGPRCLELWHGLESYQRQAPAN